MRDQLHLMELVDNYLDGTMSNDDRTAFEERMRNSEELRSLVEDQKHLRQAARRSPARAAAKKAYRSYRWGKSLPGMGAGAAVLIAATAVLFLWKSPIAGGGSENAPVGESEYRTLTDTTGTHLDPLVLIIDPKKDTTLVTPNGIVLDIPQGAFVDSLGTAISSPVRVTLLEALDPLDIMKAGLSTMSGDTLLETGGMFYLDAQADGKAVKIDPAKPLTAMVPAADEENRKPASSEVPEARVRHILFSTQGKSEEDLVRMKNRVDSVLSVVKHDRSKFEAMMEKYTEDPGSRSTGGVYEWFDKTRMVPEFTAASFDRPVGAITMCQTSYGYHIVEVLGQRTRTVSASPVNDGEMMLYQGVKTSDGTIDWQNPQPLKKSLVPVDITTLNFYPPGYEAKLAELGNDVMNKTFKDSLYFSFAGAWSVGGETGGRTIQVNADSLFESGWGIDPARIKAIWSERFSKTNLATKEFEERLRSIFPTCDNALLEVYVNNLDKDLGWCDSVAARRHPDMMSAFTEPRAGGVVLPAHSADRLRLVYTKWSRAFSEAVREEQELFTRIEGALDARSDALRAQWEGASLEQRGRLFNDAFPAYFQQAMRRAGLPVASTTYAPPRMAYVVPIVQPQWHNVDKPLPAGAVVAAAIPTPVPAPVLTRAFGLTIAERTGLDGLRAYLLPRGWQTFQRLNEREERLTADLSSNLKYDLVCLASRGGTSYWFKQDDVRGGELTARLAATDENELRRTFGRSGVRMAAALMNEVGYANWLAADNARRKKRADREALREAMVPIVFPCGSSEKATPEEVRSSTITVEDVPRPVTETAPMSPFFSIASVDQAPDFPGGVVAMQRFITTSIKYPDDLIDAGVSGKVYVQFTISANGDVTDAAVTRGIDPRLDEEALRVMRSMPRWRPASVNGNNVPCRLSLPIAFATQ